MKSRLYSWSIRVAGALLGVVLLVLVWAFLNYPAAYVKRALLWQDADVFDYQKFPERRLSSVGTHFSFAAAPDEVRVRSVFEKNPMIHNLNTFLSDTGTQAFIVIQNDGILYEKYFNGNERDSIVTSFSVAKSFASALIGVAIEEGHIRSVDDPITKYLPELAERDNRFGQITIRALLRMSSGIKYAEFPFLTGDDAKTYYYPDLRQLALEQTTIKGPPSAVFLYNNYHPLLLGLIIERATGMSVTEYLQKKIWSPLGMEFAGSWSLDSDASGFEKMESGINGRAIDVAKLGRLYLNQGNWNGTQVVPAGWVTQSTQVDGARDRETYYPDTTFFRAMNGYYGYMWWGIARASSANDFSAVGNHGQFVYVSPQKNLIIVRHGERYGVGFDQWLRAFYQFASDL